MPRSKDQMIKFGQLTAYYMKNFFIEEPSQNVVEKLFPYAFLKSQNLAYLWINGLKFYTVCFYSMPKLWAIEKD